MKHDSRPFDGQISGLGIVNNEGDNSDIRNMLHQGPNCGTKSDQLYGHTVGPSFRNLEGHVKYLEYKQPSHVFGPVSSHIMMLLRPKYEILESRMLEATP